MGKLIKIKTKYYPMLRYTLAALVGLASVQGCGLKYQFCSGVNDCSSSCVDKGTWEELTCYAYPDGGYVSVRDCTTAQCTMVRYSDAACTTMTSVTLAGKTGQCQVSGSDSLIYTHVAGRPMDQREYEATLARFEGNKGKFEIWESADYWVGLSDVMAWNGLLAPLNAPAYLLLSFWSFKADGIKDYFGYTVATQALRLMMMSAPLSEGYQWLGLYWTVFSLPLYQLLAVTYAPVAAIIKGTEADKTKYTM